MADGNVAIKVNHVSKTFKLPHEKQTSVKGALISFFRGNKRSYEKQEALKDISFEIKQGEFFGIVGRNGSGKSTLLKMLAGIYTPSQGNIQVNGKLTPFIELGVGFSPELTGRENVFLNGALLGFNRKEMDAMYDEIVEFAEIERFMDQKLKNYSSGMQVRLAFSIAIRAQSDILLIDEVLAVGDTAFQRKCFEHFVKLKREKRTVVLVTHDMGAVERFCDKAVVIDKGVFRGLFDPQDAATLYEKINNEPTKSSAKHTTNEEIESSRNWGTGDVVLSKVSVLGIGKTQGETVTIKQGDPLEIKIELSQSKEQDNPKEIVVGLAFYDQFGANIAGPNTIGQAFKGTDTITFSLDRLAFNPGRYTVTVAIFDKDVVTEFDHTEKALTLNVIADSQQHHGKINLFEKWSV